MEFIVTGRHGKYMLTEDGLLITSNGIILTDMGHVLEGYNNGELSYEDIVEWMRDVIAEYEEPMLRDIEF